VTERADVIPGWPRLLTASGTLWLSGRLLPVARRARRRRVTWAVLWVGEQCAELARRLLAAR
jgi:hypothetical protein